MLSQVQSPNPTPPETALISASWFPTTAFLQLRPFAISCNLYSYLFIETQCEHCCTFCCCDFDISLIAGFLLPPPPAGSGPCNIVYLYHDVSQCISMYYDAFQYMLYPASCWLWTVFTLLAHNFLCSALQDSHISRHFHTLQDMNYIAHNSLARDRM